MKEKKFKKKQYGISEFSNTFKKKKYKFKKKL